VKLFISLSDVKPGQNERTLIALLTASGCDPEKAKYPGKANQYSGINWNTNVYAKIQRLGWEPQPDQNPNVHGQYHLTHDAGEICVITPEHGQKFVLEFPQV
jgi:hypothetical protein